MKRNRIIEIFFIVLSVIVGVWLGVGTGLHFSK